LEDFIRLGLYSGMRSGEMLELDWARVDLDRNLVILYPEDQKNTKIGSVPLTREAHAVLTNRAKFRASHCPASPWVFCNSEGDRIASVKRSFREAVQRAGLEDVHPHDLRRTFGSWLVQRGASIQAVSALLRHSDIRITDRVYAHLNPEELARVARILDAPPPASGGDVSRTDLTVSRRPF
jgi:integrase